MGCKQAQSYERGGAGSLKGKRCIRMKPAFYKIIRFGIVGVASTAFYFGLLVTLKPLIGSVIVLTALCYVLAMGFNFLAQALFTFQTEKLTRRQLKRYTIMQGAALVANSLMMAVLVDGLSLSLVPSQLGVTAVVTIFTYMTSKNWVYV